MKTKELIKLLQEQPEDTEVFVRFDGVIDIFTSYEEFKELKAKDVREERGDIVISIDVNLSSLDLG